MQRCSPDPRRHPPRAPGPAEKATIAAEREIARLLRASDPEALRHLLQLHGARVSALLRRQFVRFDDADIDDAIALALVRSWRSRGRFDPTIGTLGAWFAAIVHNCALLVLATRQRGIQALVDLERLPASTGDAERARDQQQIAVDLHRCLNLLPQLQRDVLLADLRAGGKEAASEIARQLSTTPNSVYVARLKGIRALARTLKAMGYEFATVSLRRTRTDSALDGDAIGGRVTP